MAHARADPIQYELVFSFCSESELTVVGQSYTQAVVREKPNGAGNLGAFSYEGHVIGKLRAARWKLWTREVTEQAETFGLVHE